MTKLIPHYACRSKLERRRSFISNQIDECKDLSGLYYLLPFQKGYLVNWDIQRQIWDYVFGEEVLNIKPQGVCLTITEPLFNFTSIQETLNEILFEEYKFKSVLHIPAPLLAFFNYEHLHGNIKCAVIVDTGYSFSHIVPVYRGKVVLEGVLRIDVGGKLLTNHLKEVVSYRQLHVLDETYVMNQVKEDACYVAPDFNAEMEISQRAKLNTVQCEYVLPNFNGRRRGYLKEVPGECNSQQQSIEEQSLKMSNERISIPEILFNPSNVGIAQMGIAEAVVHSISLTPTEMHQHLYSNIVLTGGNCNFKGFKSRIEDDVRKLCPDIFHVNVFLPADPITFSWKGGRIIYDECLRPEHVSPIHLSDYKEYGHSIAYKLCESLLWTKPE